MRAGLCWAPRRRQAAGHMPAALNSVPVAGRQGSCFRLVTRCVGVRGGPRTLALRQIHHFSSCQRCLAFPAPAAARRPVPWRSRRAFRWFSRGRVEISAPFGGVRWFGIGLRRGLRLEGAAQVQPERVGLIERTRIARHLLVPLDPGAVAAQAERVRQAFGPGAGGAGGGSAGSSAKKPPLAAVRGVGVGALTAARAASIRRVKSPICRRIPGSSGTVLPAPTGCAALSMKSPPEEASVTMTRPPCSLRMQWRRETKALGIVELPVGIVAAPDRQLPAGESVLGHDLRARRAFEDKAEGHAALLCGGGR